jgi:glycosyltransferase involved in cell wall biosynthesis
MKILHLFSDWKWTGPAEPTVILCDGLEKRGNHVTIAHRAPPAGAEDSIGKRIRRRRLRGIDRFHLQPLGKGSLGLGMVRNLRDVNSLRIFIDQEGFDVVNVHQSHDHVVGGLAVRLSKKKPVIIRTDHKREALSPSWGNRFLVRVFTDGILTFSRMAHERDSRDLPISSERVAQGGLALELDRYHPEGPFRDMRAVFGIPRDDVVIGMVARFQKYRRTEVFLRALSQLLKEFPNTKAVLVGRSSQIQESVVEPTRKLGLTSNVILTGYQGANYLDTMAMMDIFVFLVAGSDGTARALREAMAMGKPAVVARRGLLPDLVQDGITGFVVDDTPENLCSALRILVADRVLRKRMSGMARDRALKEFPLERQAEKVEAFYRAIVRLGPRITGRPSARN